METIAMPGPALDTFDALHAYLTVGLGLVAEAPHGGGWRTYFHARIDWHPARSTRLLKLVLDHEGRPARMQLCASSDSNNSVFLAAPFTAAALREAVAAEQRVLARTPAASGAR